MILVNEDESVNPFWIFVMNFGIITELFFNLAHKRVSKFFLFGFDLLMRN